MNSYRTSTKMHSWNANFCNFPNNSYLTNNTNNPGEYDHILVNKVTKSTWFIGVSQCCNITPKQRVQQRELYRMIFVASSCKHFWIFHDH